MKPHGEFLRQVSTVVFLAVGLMAALGLAPMSGQTPEGSLQLVWVDRTGKGIETIGIYDGGLDLSPDGKRLAVRRREGSGGDIWLSDAVGGLNTRFTSDASQNNSVPVWSPDGSRIAFRSRRNGKSGLYVKGVDGTSADELLFESEDDNRTTNPMTWSPDGRFLVYESKPPLSPPWVLPLTGERKPFQLLDISFHAQISPDGKWIAYSAPSAPETGRFEIYISAFPSGSGKRQVSTSGGLYPRWRGDGGELYFLSAFSSGKMMAVEIRATESSLQSSSPVSLFEFSYEERSATNQAFAVSPDGQRFLIPSAKKVPAVTFSRILSAGKEPQNWLTYSGNVFGQRYSPLTQITPSNVKNLEMAWLRQFHSPGQFEGTPLVVDGILYMVATNSISEEPSQVAAFDAASGKMLWNYSYRLDPRARATGEVVNPNRGMAIHGGTLFLGTLDARLMAIDAYSGTLIWNIAVADPADPLCGPSPNACYNITHAPLVVKDTVIVGVGGGDTSAGRGIRGFIAAFDVKTGKEVWRFHTIPAPGEPGNETWSGDSWKTGGAALWNTGSYDPELNLTYWGTGNPSPNGNPSVRLGDNLYSDSVVALDADTGKLKWHYQFTPHDDQDWDAAQVPVLVDMDWEGRPRKVMLFANRNGLMYVLDRSTGKFLMGKPFVELNWMDGFDEEGRPSRVSGAVRIMPRAATNWFPPSYSPSTALFYIPSWERGPAPRPSPGYGAVRAFDPQTGEKKWEFKRNDAIFTAGVLTTASDVLFTGVSGDYYSGPDASSLAGRYFFALDGRTGDLLWQIALPESPRSGPISYSVNGKQYIAISAGSTLFAFALRR